MEPTTTTPTTPHANLFSTTPLGSAEEDSEIEAGAAALPGADAADAWSNIEPPAEGDPARATAATLLIEEAIDPAPIAAELPAIEEPSPPPAVDLPENEAEDECEERGGWTVALLGAGIAIIAACLLLPLAEENHQLAWQREKLKVDLEQIKQQVEVNGEFLRRVSDDPTLAERLAQRQMKFIRQGTSILDLHDGGDASQPQQSSPFQLMTLPPPNPIPAYRPLGGALSAIVRNSRARLYLIGVGLLLLATGLVLGGGAKQTHDESK